MNVGHLEGIGLDNRCTLGVQRNDDVLLAELGDGDRFLRHEQMVGRPDDRLLLGLRIARTGEATQRTSLRIRDVARESLKRVDVALAANLNVLRAERVSEHAIGARRGADLAAVGADKGRVFLRAVFSRIEEHLVIGRRIDLSRNRLVGLLRGIDDDVDLQLEVELQTDVAAQVVELHAFAGGKKEEGRGKKEDARPAQQTLAQALQPAGNKVLYVSQCLHSFTFFLVVHLMGTTRLTPARKGPKYVMCLR